MQKESLKSKFDSILDEVNKISLEIEARNKRMLELKSQLQEIKKDIGVAQTGSNYRTGFDELSKLK